MKVWEMKQYTERNANLKILGFASYGAYLSSTLWKRIRLKVLIRNKFKCHSCRKQAVQVHHKSYRIEVLQGKAQNELVPICGICHLTNGGDKVGPSTANKRLNKLKNAPKADKGVDETKKRKRKKPKKSVKTPAHKPDPKNPSNLQLHKICTICKIRSVSKKVPFVVCTRCFYADKNN